MIEHESTSEQLSKPTNEHLQVIEVYDEGNLRIQVGDAMSSLIAQAGRALDKACAWEIAGGLLVKMSDGKFYTAVCEVEFIAADRDFVKDELEGKELDECICVEQDNEKPHEPDCPARKYREEIARLGISGDRKFEVSKDR